MRPPTSLVERLGGVDAVHLAVDDLYRRVLADPALQPYFAHVDMAAQRRHMTEFLLAVLAPRTRPADEARLTSAHAPLHLTDDVFDRTAGHLLDTLAARAVEPRLIDDVIVEIAALRSQVVAVR